MVSTTAPSSDNHNKSLRGTIASVMRLAYLILPLLFTAQAFAGGLKVVLRYDDYSSNGAAEMRLDMEERIFKAADEMGLGVLVGVIPFPNKAYPQPGEPETGAILSQAKTNLLIRYAQRKVVHVAVHGYSHVNNAKPGTPSEMAGLPKELQTRLLADAKAAMERVLDLPVVAFIPPFNAFDEATLEAMIATGYRLLSAGAPRQDWLADSLYYLPSGPYPTRLRQITESLRTSGRLEGILLITMHAYDFSDSGESLPAFRSKPLAPKPDQISIENFLADLAWLKQQPGVEFTTIDQLIAGNEDLSAERLIANIRWHNNFIERKSLLPKMLALSPTPGVYYPKDLAIRMHRAQQGAFILFYGSILLVFYKVPRFFIKPGHPPRRSTIAMHAIFGLAAPVIILAISMQKLALGSLYINWAILATASLGILLGTLRAYRTNLLFKPNNPRITC